MGIVIGALSPHPPLLVLGMDADTATQVKATDDSLRELAQRLKEAKPQRLIVMSPHAPVHPNAFPIYLEERLQGNMARFRRPDVSLAYGIDVAFSKRLFERCQERGLRCFALDKENSDRYGFSLDMDHGTFVPLHYLHEAGLNMPLVLLGTSELSPTQHRRLGEVLGELLREDEVPTAILASGDLSHKLVASGPYGFDEYGPVFDEQITAAVRANDPDAAEAIPSLTVSRAAQCGLRPIMTLLGVCYCVAYWEHTDVDDAPKQEAQEQAPAADKAAPAPSPSAEGDEDIRLSLARRAVEEYIRHDSVLPADPALSELAEPAPTFVTLKIDGELRGCIGTLAATCASQQEEIIQNAISACSRDPRFPKVTVQELPHLQYQVYVLGPLEEIAGPELLDPKRYGVVVGKGYRRGVLLPNLEGIDTVEQQLAIASRKGGISMSEKPTLYRFEVITYGKD